MALSLKPISLRVANTFVKVHHAHHGPSRGHKFSIGVIDDKGALLGVVIVGRPKARGLDNGYTAEVTRLCVLRSESIDTSNICSMLYSAAWRAARGMGYQRICTYVLESETAISLKASNWSKIHEVKGRSWSCPSRPREDKHPLDDKVMWGMGDW